VTENAQQRYRVVEKLESGGMAEVFRAESEGLQGFRKQVAIKRVLPHLSEKKKFISMFLDEARLSAHLSHSNCVQVFDIGVGDNAFFIVMEFVDGANLKSIAESLKKQGKDFPVAGAALIAHEICKGLTYAHELTDQNGVPLHIVHRDMSPPNVLVTKFGEVKIVDFGLAKASSQLEKSEPGIIKGKFSYLSPEAALGQEVDARTDIFAVGIILWELLAGQRLFLGDTDFQTVKKVQVAQIPPISQINRKVPPELERILNKSLAKDPLQRYTTARELGQDLTRFMFSFGQPISTFDIATIVQSTMREKQRVRQPQGSIIDKLIEEALFEFTSLKEDGQPQSQSARPASSPLTPEQFVDPTNWANEIAIGERPGATANFDPVRASLPPDIFDGNLSALEDAPMSSSPSSPPSAGGSPASHPSTPPMSGGPSGRTGAHTAQKGGGGGSSAAIGVVIFLVCAAAAGAAWFTGLIPHH
jgi:eukaryotic-like serine/threonine-protein kinase